MTKIIAEIGVNHNGKLSLQAKKLIDMAKLPAVEQIYVKFQTFVPEDVVISQFKISTISKKKFIEKNNKPC